MFKILKKIKNKLNSILVKIKNKNDQNSQNHFVSMVSKKAPWVYIAYIPDPFFHKKDQAYLDSHQNKREAIAQVEVFREQGYNVFVQNYLSKEAIPNIKFDIVFGHEPNFMRAALRNPHAIKVHYVPGAFIGHRNNQIFKITDTFNDRYKSSVPYRRLLVFDDPAYSAEKAYDLADQILLIGSKFTIETFPAYLRPKITTIHQSTQTINIDRNFTVASSKHFFFMGSSGNLLKGVSLLVEYFSLHTEYTLHIVGPIEDDVKDALQHIISSNIIFYGFVNANSELMREVMSKCNFVIYPSGSEGSPGAVLNSMKNGLIPIVTKWSAFDEINDYGFVLDSWDIESIDLGVKWALSLTESEIIHRKRNCSQYVEKTYNIDRYKKEFSNYFVGLINHRKKML